MYKDKLYVSDYSQTYFINSTIKEKICNGFLRFILNDRMFIRDGDNYVTVNKDGSGPQFITREEFEKNNLIYYSNLNENGFYTILKH